MKHILNNLSEQEKNSIREQHTGGIKVMTESFSKLLNSKLGDVKPLVSEQSVLGRLGNAMEITGQLAINLANILPPTILSNMAKSAISGDAKTFNQVLDQEKARLGQDYTKLKNALTQGDITKTLKNIGAELQPYVKQMESGMGNQPKPSTMSKPTAGVRPTGVGPQKPGVKPTMIQKPVSGTTATTGALPPPDKNLMRQQKMAGQRPDGLRQGDPRKG
jgi:hypothetical protein